MAWNIRASRQISPDLDILKFPAGIETAASIVLDASAVAVDTDGVRRLKAGTLLSKNSNSQYERYTGAGAANEVDAVAFGGSAAGGTFTLGVAVGLGDEETTADITFSATAATMIANIKAALEALAGITTANVTGSASPYAVTIAAPANQDVAIRVIDNDLTPAGATVAVTTTTEGDTAQAIKGVLAHTVEFVDNTSKSDQPAAMWFHGVIFRADRIIDFGSLGSAARTALPMCRFD